jgi:hypothetical protein
MDFVASREEEARYGWRNRIGDFLRSQGAIVFDPWNKPQVRGFHEYGKEDDNTPNARNEWSYAQDENGSRKRAALAESFWETLHIDLRMVDVSDLIIAYCPTNVYSVGTPHEIIVARQQRKPVLFVSPPVEFTALAELEKSIAHLPEATDLLRKLCREVPIKPNPRGIPSLWYMPLIGTESFFDGFGFGLPEFQEEPFSDLFSWDLSHERDKNEREGRYQRPLLPFLVDLVAGKYPMNWDSAREEYRKNDDWLILESSIAEVNSNGSEK